MFLKYSVAEKCCQSKVYATIIIVHNNHQTVRHMFLCQPLSPLPDFTRTCPMDKEFENWGILETRLETFSQWGMSINTCLGLLPVSSSWLCWILLLHVPKPTILVGKGWRKSFEKRTMTGQGAQGFEEALQSFDSWCLLKPCGRARGDNNPAICIPVIPCPTSRPNDLHYSPLANELKDITILAGWKFLGKGWLSHLFFVFRENNNLIFRCEYYIPHVTALHKT